jgi:hypothetical protein
MRRDYRERLAEIPRLGPNDGDRAFHRNRDGRGGRAPVNQHHQLRNLSGCPRSTTDAHHMTQSVGSGFVPPDCDGRQLHVTGVRTRGKRRQKMPRIGRAGCPDAGLRPWSQFR